MTDNLMYIAFEFVTLIMVAILGLLVGFLLKRRSGANINVQSSIQHMRAIGQLSVFKVITKEIVTENDHTWGEFGSKYMQWVLTNKKMAIIFEFEIDFRYDLRRPEFEIIGVSNSSYIIKMPPCFFEVHIRDMRFYDEQKSRLLPWLLPDLLNGFVPGGFSEEDKNKLVVAAKEHAEKQAIELISNLQCEVQNSAKTTLISISKAFGAENVAFDFMPQGAIKLNVGVSSKLVA